MFNFTKSEEWVDDAKKKRNIKRDIERILSERNIGCETLGHRNDMKWKKYRKWYIVDTVAKCEMNEGGW